MAGYVVTVFVSIIVALSLVGLGARFGYEFGACQVSTGYELPRRHQIRFFDIRKEEDPEVEETEE